MPVPGSESVRFSLLFTKQEPDDHPEDYSEASPKRYIVKRYSQPGSYTNTDGCSHTHVLLHNAPDRLARFSEPVGCHRSLL